jgi:RNA polymerase sigma-70 factor (sigma-E family)
VHSDDPELREFLAHRRNALLRSAYLMCGDAHAAEDLIKVVMARRGRRRVDHLDAYARRVLVTTYIASQKRFWNREHPHGELPDAPERGDGDVDLGLAVRQALQLLAPRQRAVLVLRFFEDQSVQATAELLGVSEGTVKSQTARGLTVLRAALGDAVGDVVDEELAAMRGVIR